MVKDPATGKMVTTPEYGGTFTLADRPGYSPSVDPYFGPVAGPMQLDVEQLGIGNWALDRDIFDFKGWMPLSAITGGLAESWDNPDPKTIVVHIRKGVHWHNEPPVNGREFTAKDVEYNYHRILALGSGFTEPAAFGYPLKGVPFESITATDKYTVFFKLKQPNLDALYHILVGPSAYIFPPEVIEQYGDVNDWRNMVGTGPYVLTDWVEDSSMTWTKNPDYWRTDEKYPANRLPYIDEIKSLNMPEMATKMAALRTGRVDHLGMRGNRLKSLDLAESLQKTTPEIVLHEIWYRNDNVFAMNLTKPPFNDIRVRKALQMAVDVETISATYFKGFTDPTPQGRIAVPGWYIPFEEWPREVKKGYRYDPKAAEALLDEAGYPRSADGIRFKTGADLESAKPIGWQPIAVEYWRAIGVAVETQLLDEAAGVDRILAHSYDGFTMWEVGGVNAVPILILGYSHSESGFNPPGVKDPVYDELVEAARAATTIEEQKRAVIDADMRAIEQHWIIWGPKLPLWLVMQPWVKGFNGELSLGVSDIIILARLWIDQELKKEMGH